MTELRVGAVLERVFGVYKDQFATLVGVALMVNLVSALLGLIPGYVGLLLAFVGALVVGTLYAGMVVRLVQDMTDGRRDWSTGQLVSSIGPVLLPLIVVGIITGIAIAIGFLLLVVPGLILITIWAVVAPVVVVEGASPIQALGRSRELVKGNGWPVFGAVVLAGLLQAIVSGVAGAIGGAIDGDIAIFALDWLLPAFVLPISALVAAVLYFALRDGTTTEPEPTVPDTEWPESYAPPSAG